MFLADNSTGNKDNGECPMFNENVQNPPDRNAQCSNVQSVFKCSINGNVQCLNSNIVLEISWSLLVALGFGFGYWCLS